MAQSLPPVTKTSVTTTAEAKEEVSERRMISGLTVVVIIVGVIVSALLGYYITQLRQTPIAATNNTDTTSNTTDTTTQTPVKTQPDFSGTFVKLNNSVLAASDTLSAPGVVRGTSGKGDVASAAHPYILYENGVFRMWYEGTDIDGHGRIYYATSDDGIVWTKSNNAIPDASDTTSTDGRLALGTAGKGDSFRVYRPSIVKVNDTYMMWYAGTPDGTVFREFLATSLDGLTWTKVDNSIPAASDTTSTAGRIPLGTAGKGDEQSVSAGDVLYEGGAFKMWYNGQAVGGLGSTIFYATSTDGLIWTKYDNATPEVSDTVSTNGKIPLGTSGHIDSNGIGAMSIISNNGKYTMWYVTVDTTSRRIGEATSTDGLIWTKAINTLGQFNSMGIPFGGSGTADEGRVAGPRVIFNPQAQKYYMYYLGTLKDSNSGSILMAIEP